MKATGTYQDIRGRYHIVWEEAYRGLRTRQVSQSTEYAVSSRDVHGLVKSGYWKKVSEKDEV